MPSDAVEAMPSMYPARHGNGSAHSFETLVEAQQWVNARLRQSAGAARLSGAFPTHARASQHVAAWAIVYSIDQCDRLL
jgi:hypothetical protein